MNEPDEHTALERKRLLEQYESLFNASPEDELDGDFISAKLDRLERKLTAGGYIGGFSRSEVGNAIRAIPEIDTEQRRSDQVWRNNMAGHYKYAHFPLALLGIQTLEPRASGRPKTGAGEEQKRRLIRRLVWFTVFHLAKHIIKQNGLAAPHVMTKHPPKGFNVDNPLQRAVATAMGRLDVRGESETIKSIDETRRESEEFLNAHKDCPNVLVRLPMNTLASFFHRTEKTELDLRVLCAINSCIGRASYAIVGAEDLGRRAMGAANGHALDSLGVKPLSRFQVYASLDRLEEMGFIHLVVYRRRSTFVCRSYSMSADDLRAIARNFSKRKSIARRKREEDGLD